MKHHASPAFWTHYHTLSDSVRELSDKSFTLLKSDPRHPSLHFKKVAKELLERLKGERLVLDWRKKQQARAAVRQLIEQMLDRLPSAYSKAVYEQVCEQAYLHVHDCYHGDGKSVYSIPPASSASRAI